jgi:hypothetical protein
MTTDIEPIEVASEISGPPCPYIQKGEDGTQQCELAEVGLRVLTTKLKTAKQEAGDWKHEHLMFANAWKRELGGKLIPKTHLIDALVLTTRDMREELEQLRKPIPMILLCPNCKTQHVDALELKCPKCNSPDPKRHPAMQFEGEVQLCDHPWHSFDKPWDNPPHKSHFCHVCKTVWRPADVPTVGVKTINTRGDADTWQPGE